MKYLLQIMVMIGDVMVMVGCAILLWAFKWNFFAFVLVALALWQWCKLGAFESWKPKNIKAFMSNWDKMMGKEIEKIK